uniref:NAC domain-containing protein n=1 Tax=Arundo donax TaxID=35708 RepID=A0A0A9G8R8_ARUDO
MNEYRLPHGEADRYQKEISLCRVYKRPGIEDNFHLTTTTTRSSGSKASATVDKKHRTSASSRLAPMFDRGHSSALMNKPYNGTNTGMTSPAAAPAATMALQTPMFLSTASLSSTTSTEEDGTSLYHIKGANPPMLPSSTHALLNANSTTMATIPIDELSRAIGSYNNQANPNQPLPPQGPLLPFPSMEKIWDWNPMLESPKVCTSFK